MPLFTVVVRKIWNIILAFVRWFSFGP